jgi:Cohesin domain
MKNSYVHFYFFILVILLNSVLLSQTSVFVSPASLTINIAGMVSIQILVNNVTNLHAASVTIGFDSTVLRYSSISSGTFLQSNSMGYSVFVGKTFYPNNVSPNQVKVD